MGPEWQILSLISEAAEETVAAGTIVKRFSQTGKGFGQPIGEKGPVIVVRTDKKGWQRYIVARDAKLAKYEPPPTGWTPYFLAVASKKATEAGLDGITTKYGGQEVIVFASAGAVLAPGWNWDDLRGQLQTMLSQHGSVDKVAKEIGMESQDLRNLMKRAGVNAPQAKGFGAGRPAGGGKAPDPEKFQELLQATGKTGVDAAREIAQQLGVSTGAVYHWARSYGISMGGVAGRKPGAPAAEKPQQFGPDTARVAGIKQAAIDRQESRREEIISAFEKNDGNVVATAKELDMNPVTLRYWLRKLDVKLTGKPGRKPWDPSQGEKPPTETRPRTEPTIKKHVPSTPAPDIEGDDEDELEALLAKRRAMFGDSVWRRLGEIL